MAHDARKDPLSREETLRILTENKKIIADFGAKSLAIFGSVARDAAHDASDLDVLVEFDPPANFDRYMGLRLFLEDTLGCRVDLVTTRGLKPRARAYVDREAIYVP
jgi:predicted nucleotidyltransferase